MIDALEIAVHHLAEVIEAKHVMGEIIHLKMATIAINCAIDIQKGQLTGSMKKEEKQNGNLQGDDNG